MYVDLQLNDQTKYWKVCTVLRLAIFIVLSINLMLMTRLLE